MNLVSRVGGSEADAVTVSYADFVIVSAIEFGRRVGKDVFDGIVAMDPAFGREYEACRPWLERNDH